MLKQLGYVCCSSSLYISALHRSTDFDRKKYTGLFGMNVGVLTTCHLFLQMQPQMISFYGGYVKDQVYVPPLPAKYRYESEPPLKPSPLTCYGQFGTNWIIVLMFVESQRVHI